MKHYRVAYIALCICAASCTKADNGEAAEAKLIFRYRFDSTQERLNNTGQPASLPDGNAAQSPVFNSMNTHYIELALNASTPLGKGVILYKAPETDAGGEAAIDFERSVSARNNEVFYAMSLKDIASGEYEWLRISLAYQNYSVQYHIDTTITIATDTTSSTIVIDQDLTGTIASFIGYNTYLKSYLIKTQSLTVDGNRKQGYWGFETTLSGEGFNEMYTTSGQSPEGGTTVVNPIFDTSPVPAGSCVVTAAFIPGKLVITGKETENIIVEVSLSTNKSFEWKEVVNNGKWDPLKGEPVVDMGIRGMIPTIK
ncbi:hypothetical protein [Agriterribacter humi]|uniref:hypothetical protein n=1 Tax=Agriterribacter humi TaxID=1104781 RepID=UPI0012651429|nr:hypothetical protein [Agriterribacter humi]